MEGSPKVTPYLTLRRHLNTTKHSRESDDLRPLDNLKYSLVMGTPECLAFPWEVVLPLEAGSFRELAFGLVFSSVAQSRLTLCGSMDCSTTGLPVHHQLPEFTQIHVH